MVAVVISIIVLAWLSVFMILGYKNIISRKLDQKDMELKNKQYELFMQMDVNLALEEIEKYIDIYMNRYIVYNIYANDVLYINEAISKDMIIKVREECIRNIPDIQIFYIKIQTSIRDEEDLYRYIDLLVKEKVLNFMTEFNVPK